MLTPTERRAVASFTVLGTHYGGSSAQLPTSHLLGVAANQQHEMQQKCWIHIATIATLARIHSSRRVELHFRLQRRDPIAHEALWLQCRSRKRNLTSSLLIKASRCDLGASAIAGPQAGWLLPKLEAQPFTQGTAPRGKYSHRTAIRGEGVVTKVQGGI